MMRALPSVAFVACLAVASAKRLGGNIMDVELFKNYVVGELHAAANAMEAVTSKDDVLLFLGQSPAYVQTAMACKRNNTLRIAGSGMSKYNKKDLLSLAQEPLDGYCAYLSSAAATQGIDLAGAARDGRIVAIDLSETGNSVNFFAKMLGRCYSEFKAPMRFVNLCIDTKGALFGFNPDVARVKVLEYIVLRHAGALAWDEVPRIVPSWKMEQWNANGPDSSSIGALAAEFDAAVSAQCGASEDGDGVVAIKPSNPESLREMRVQFNRELCAQWSDAFMC